MTENENPQEETDPSETAPPAKKRRLGKILVALFSLMILSVFVGYQYLDDEFNRPANPKADETMRIHIRPGMSFAQILELLEKSNVIRNPGLFRLQARFRGGAKNFQAGVYALKASMSPREIYRYLSEGRVVQRTITIPEGYNIREIARTIQRAKLTSAGEILRISRDPSFLRELNITAASLEGYLFPDTYALPRTATAADLVEAMVARFEQAFDEPLRRDVVDAGRTVREIVTLASLIERETALAEERAVVSAVYTNRLRIDMALQCDPTVIYALERAGLYEGNLTRDNLRYDSPYNTYVYPGLPPGPIAAPGRSALEAAVRPADAGYLYFVSRNDGSHVFASSLREHNRNVREYQIRYFREARGRR